MPNDPIDTQSDKTTHALHAFLDAFGERDAVLKEIHDYWDKGGSPFPLEVYNHLLQVQVDKGLLKPERRKFFEDYFAESFAPERVTWYFSKHREPVINGLAQAYMDHFRGEKPLFRVEADITNLGGLNRVIEQTNGRLTAHEKRELADSVIRVMTSSLRKHVQGTAQRTKETPWEVCATRHGGDEMRLLLKVPDGVTEDDIQKRLNLANKEIAAFLRKAGLQNIEHLKRGKKPGVGIGSAVINLCDKNAKCHVKSDVQQRTHLEKEIRAAKERFHTLLNEETVEGFVEKLPGHSLDALHKQTDREFLKKKQQLLALERLASMPGGWDDYKLLAQLAALRREMPAALKRHHEQTADIQKQRIGRLIGAFGTRYADCRKAAATPDPVLKEDSTHGWHLIPDEARKQLMRACAEEKGGALSDAEDRLLEKTHTLTVKNDHVTDLPMFGDMQRDLLPHFIRHYGRGDKKVTLVHFDFNNMGGGNSLGSWVGDAMGKEFAQAVLQAMSNTGLDAFKPYLTSQGGGKYALLLQHNISRDILSRLHLEVEKQLVERSTKALPLSKEQRVQTLALAQERNKEIEDNNAKLQEQWPADHRKARRDRRRPLPQITFKDENEITIAEILHLKTHRKGASVICLSRSVDTEPVTLHEGMEDLETRTGRSRRVADQFIVQKERDKESDRSPRDKIVPHRELLHRHAQQSPISNPLTQMDPAARREEIRKRIFPDSNSGVNPAR